MKFCSKSATEQSTIIVEKRDEKNEVVDVSPVKSVIYPKPLPGAAAAAGPFSHVTDSNQHDQQSNVLQTKSIEQTSFKQTTSSITVKNNAENVLVNSKNLTIESQQTIKLNTAGSTTVTTTTTATAAASSLFQASNKLANTKPQIPSNTKTNQPANVNEQVNKTPVLNNNKPKAVSKPNVANLNKPNPQQPQLPPLQQHPQQQQLEKTPVTNSEMKSLPKTPLKHSTTSIEHSISQHLLAPAKIDKNFITKIVFILYFLS